MPRHVRNFWIDATVDGRDTSLASGPTARDGGFELIVFVRDQGQVKQALRIAGYASGDDLTISVSVAGRPEKNFDIKTTR